MTFEELQKIVYDAGIVGAGWCLDSLLTENFQTK